MAFNSEKYHNDPEYREMYQERRRRYYQERKLRDPDFGKRERERSAARYAALSTEERKAENKQYRRGRTPRTREQMDRKNELRRLKRAEAAGIASSDESTTKARKARVKRESKQPSSLLRHMYGKAHPNSAMRKKYPTRKSFYKAVAEGRVRDPN